MLTNNAIDPVIIKPPILYTLIRSYISVVYSSNKSQSIYIACVSDSITLYSPLCALLQAISKASSNVIFSLLIIQP